jgi:hypothetical protein
LNANQLKAAQTFSHPVDRLRDVEKMGVLASDTGGDLAEAVRKYHPPDFPNWQPPAAFARAFARLEKDLRTSTL